MEIISVLLPTMAVVESGSDHRITKGRFGRVAISIVQSTIFMISTVLANDNFGVRKDGYWRYRGPAPTPSTIPASLR
jgi:hypothetical protein